MRPLLKSSPRPLLKSGLGPLARYGTHQETINGRPEQVYLPSDPSLEWPGTGPLFESDSNKRRGQNAATIRVISWDIIEVRSGALSYGTHQETISRRPERMYTPADTRLKWPGEGPLFESDSNKRRGPNETIFRVTFPALLKSGLRLLARCGTHGETVSRKPEQM